MIVIVTGAPGSGKSLWTMQEVCKVAEKSKRPVYYSHIPDVTLPWSKLGDEASWSDSNKTPQAIARRLDYHEVPQGSIVVIDEAWAQFPVRPAGTAKPDYIEAFATHRHRGHDIYLLSQNAGQLDQFIRGMVNRHIHLERQFGLNKATTWSWESKLGRPEDYFSKKDATQSQFIYPKKYFSAYKSSDLHVVQQRLPLLRLAGIAALCLLAIGLIYSVLHRGFGAGKKADTAQDLARGDQVHSQGPAAGTQVAAQAYAGRFKERVQGMPYSAPFYDSKVVPVTYPRVSGCILYQSPKLTRCTCNTQQGTTITSITYSECYYYVKNGSFDFGRPDTQDASAPAPRLALNNESLSEATQPAPRGLSPF